jgi:hypothetical protein
VEIHITRHVVVGNRWAGDTCTGLLGNTLPKKALVYTNQGGSMTLKTAWHWSSNRSVVHDPLGDWLHPIPHRGSVDGDHLFSLFRGTAL